LLFDASNALSCFLPIKSIQNFRLSIDELIGIISSSASKNSFEHSRSTKGPHFLVLKMVKFQQQIQCLDLPFSQKNGKAVLL